MTNWKLRVRKKKDLKESEQADIDVTPMLNVLYILLFFFVIGSQFDRDVGIGLNKAEVHPTHNPLTIVIEVMRNGDIHIQDRKVFHQAITATINRLKGNNADAPLVVRIDSRTKTKYLVRAIDNIRAANVFLPSVSIF
jgi:biopolymer transport protein ExbD